MNLFNRSLTLDDVSFLLGKQSKFCCWTCLGGVGSSDCQAENQILGKGVPHKLHKVRVSFLVSVIVLPFS